MITAIRDLIKRLPSWVYWSALGVIGLLIIIFNDAFGEVEGFVIFSLIYFVILTFSIIRWIVLQIKSIITLKRDKTRMEMLHLKSQVSPHFFFNTLNNLYGLVDSNPKEAQALILKLSDLMRYSIYEGQNEWVSLEDLKVLDPGGSLGAEDTKPTFISGFIVRQLIKDGSIKI